MSRRDPPAGAVGASAGRGIAAGGCSVLGVGKMDEKGLPPWSNGLVFDRGRLVFFWALDFLAAGLVTVAVTVADDPKGERGVDVAAAAALDVDGLPHENFGEG